MRPDKISLKKAGKDDCLKIHEMQVKSFKSLLDKYGDYATNPAAEPIEKVEQRMAQAFTEYYFICLNDEPIGAVRIVSAENALFKISPIFILPQYQGKGYASKAVLKVEALYPQAKGWSLGTIKQEAKLRHFYEKMGYKATGEETRIHEGMDIIGYAK